jgi:hypothetical protein
MLTNLVKAFDRLARATHTSKQGESSVFAKGADEQLAKAIIEVDEEMDSFFRKFSTLDNHDQHKFVLDALFHANSHFNVSQFAGQKGGFDHNEPGVLLPFFNRLVEISSFNVAQKETPLADWKSLEAQCRLSRDEVRRAAEK